VDDGGCGYYRIRQPFEFIKRFTDADVHIVDSNNDDMMSVAWGMSIANVMVFRQGGEIGIPHIKDSMKEYYRNMGIPGEWKPKWVLDIDDNPEIISPYSQHYEEYGTEEFMDNNTGKWLWKDGVANFDLKRNRTRMASLINGMKSVDLVTVTTNKLAEYARQYNKNVKVLPNCINLDRWWKLPLKTNEQLRVGWSGGVSHYEDWYSIKEPLNKLMREYQFKLIQVGANFEGIIDPDNRHLVEIHDWVPFKGHSYRMMCMALDFAIIPLANLPFNHYKSSIKWYEMSALGIPSVVSNTLPYSEDVRHEKTGLLYKNSKEFYEAMKTLITRATVRHAIGAEARKWVEGNRSAKEWAKLYVEAYS
jgi:glycosyltransferase involved in cell wall biosynthesis